MLRFAGFFAAVWFGGKAAKYVRISSIVFEIIIGLVFSPGILPLQLLPEVYSNCAHSLTDAAKASAMSGVGSVMSSAASVTSGAGSVMSSAGGTGMPGGRMLGGGSTDAAKYCGSEPNIFSFIGHMGVGLMIFESGMHFDFDGCKRVLPKATIVAVFGTFSPLVAGMLLTGAFGYPMYPDGFAAGVALAPTSVGIALKLLMEAQVLQKDFGQLILTAAFVDDILSLVIFNILFAITSPSGFDAITCVVFPVIGCIFMVAAGALGISFWPKLLDDMKQRINDEKRFMEFVMTLMFFLLLAYGSFTMVLGTHLWGAFTAGMSFAGYHQAHHIWSHQTKRMTAWMLRVFFSCTVAFAIPFKALFTIEAFLYGSVMGIVACILTKVLAGICMGDAKYVIGWAMVGRAEFAYLIAEMAKSGGILSNEMFAIVIWSLLYATIIAPIVFKVVLGKYIIAMAKVNGEDVEAVKEQVASMNRARTLDTAFPDLVAIEKKDKIEKDRSRLTALEENTRAKDEEIDALKKQISVNSLAAAQIPDKEVEPEKVEEAL